MAVSTTPAPPATTESHLQDLVVISGFSGAGKSTAMAVFEDAGYFCVDNLPPEMIRSLVELFTHEGSKVERAAVVSDVRGGEFFEPLEGVLDELHTRELPARVLFLDADDLTLMDRYKETRRRHPLAPESSIASGIAAERAMLGPIRDRSDFVIDSSGLEGLAPAPPDCRRAAAAPPPRAARADDPELRLQARPAARRRSGL